MKKSFPWKLYACFFTWLAVIVLMAPVMAVIFTYGAYFFAASLAAGALYYALGQTIKRRTIEHEED